jgi:hypothetical protein
MMMQCRPAEPLNEQRRVGLRPARYLHGTALNVISVVPR